MKRSAPLQRRTPIKRGKPLQRKTGLKRGAPPKRTTGLKRGSGPKRTGRRSETAAHKRARLCFNAEVVTERICFFLDVNEAGDRRRPNHVCSEGELDAHHLISKSWIQKHFGDLPEDELLAIKYAVIIGCPLCRAAHDALPANLHCPACAALPPRGGPLAQSSTRREHHVTTFLRKVGHRVDVAFTPEPPRPRPAREIAIAARRTETEGRR